MAILDGRPAEREELSALALTNLGHFTTMRVGGDGRVRGLALHLERLERDCRAVWGAELDTARVLAHVRQAVDGRDGPCTVRVTVFDPAVELAHPVAADRPRVLVTVRPAGAMPPAPLRARSVPYARDLPEVKHVGLFGPLHARRAAQLDGYDDALFVGPGGHVSEGVTWNVGFVADDGAVLWPDAPVLPGVTMALLRRHAEHRVAPVTLEQATGMRAAFATNTAIGVRALSRIDTTPMDTAHPVLDRLRETYLSIPGEPLAP